MQFIFSTGSLYTYGLERCFRLASQAGFDGVELMVDHRWDTRQPEYLRHLQERYQQPIIAVHSPFSPRVAGWPTNEPDRIQASIELAEAVGAQVVVHHLPVRMGWMTIQVGSKRIRLPIPGWKLHADYRQWLLEEYPVLQANTEVVLAIENMPARRLWGLKINAHEWNTTQEIARFPTLTLDTTHLGTWGLDPTQVYERLRGHVTHVHLSNFNGREHRRPEDGHLALDRLLAHMAADHYQGAISLELHPDALGAGSPDTRIVALLRASLVHCRTWTTQQPA